MAHRPSLPVLLLLGLSLLPRTALRPAVVPAGRVAIQVCGLRSVRGRPDDR